MHFDHQNLNISNFVELQPELFQVYIGLADEALLVEEQLRSTAESQYKETMLRAQRAAEIEERRVGKECLRLGRSRWSPYH